MLMALVVCSRQNDSTEGFMRVGTYSNSARGKIFTGLEKEYEHVPSHGYREPGAEPEGEHPDSALPQGYLEFLEHVPGGAPRPRDWVECRDVYEAGRRDGEPVEWKLGQVDRIESTYHSDRGGQYRTFNIWVTADGTSEPRLWEQVSFPAYRVTFIGYTRWGMGHLMKNIRTGAEPQPWTTRMKPAARPVGAPERSALLRRALVPVRADGMGDPWETVAVPRGTQAALTDLVIAWAEFVRCGDTPAGVHTKAAMETVMALEARGLPFRQSDRAQVRTAVDMFHVLELRLEEAADVELVLCAFIVMHCKVSKSHARKNLKHRARLLYIIHST
jgi:hypothetical protein